MGPTASSPIASPGRVDGHLVCGGKWHDFDFARLQLLTLAAEDERLRLTVAQDYRNLDALGASSFLVTYTCDVRPSAEEQAALRAFVERGGRWLALHATNSAIDPPNQRGIDPFTTPRAFPLLADTLGSQFLCHPPMEPYRVSVAAGAHDDPLVAGIEPFDTGEHEELYLCEYHGSLVPLLETRWSGTTRGFAACDWPDDEPRLVMYRRPLGAGEVVYNTLGHCRSTWDMVHPPFDGSAYPRRERGSWEVPAYRELLRRGLRWAAFGNQGAER